MINRYGERLGTERMSPPVFKTILPAVAAQFVNLPYSMIDRIYISHIPGIGTDVLAGAGITTSLAMLISSFSAIVGGSDAPLAAIVLGQGDRLRAGKILGNGFILLTLLTLFTSLIAYIFMESVLLFTGALENTLEYAVNYLPIYLLGIISTEIFTGLNSSINVQRCPAIVVYSVLIGALLNTVLDSIFTFWFGIGVKGVALTIVLSQVCSAVWALTFLFFRYAPLPLEKRYMASNREIILSIFTLGISPSITASTESLVGFVLDSSLRNFGDIYISALTILQSAMQFASVSLTRFAQGFVPIVSYNYGYGDKQRVKDCFRVVLITTFPLNLLLMLFIILFPSTVASVFTSDERLIETVRWATSVFLGGVTIFGLQRACQDMFVALGQVRIFILIALLHKAILLIPLALILPHFMGVAGVYAAEVISDATAAICCTLLSFWQSPRILGKIQRSTSHIS